MCVNVNLCFCVFMHELTCERLYDVSMLICKWIFNHVHSCELVNVCMYFCECMSVYVKIFVCKC